MECSITADPSINGWTESAFTRNRKGMRREHMSAQTARIAAISGSFRKSGNAGHTMVHMTDGGDMILCRS